MTAAPILKRALGYGALLALGIAIVGSIAGYFVAGLPGVFGALTGAGLTAVFLGLTAATILLAARASKAELFSPVFFGIVMGGWLVKLVVFLALVFALSRQDFFDPYVFFVTVVVAVLGSLVVDVLAFTRSRVPYVSDVRLPHEDERG